MNPTETSDPMGLLALCRTLEASADEIAGKIIGHWGEIGRTEPWSKLPDHVDFDHLPELIRALAAAALCSDFEHDLCWRVVELSATHGQHRAAEGFDDTLLYREYHLLRRALWHQMKLKEGERPQVYHATMRVDALITLANGASLYGLNRDALEREGRWPTVLEKFLDQWPLPTP